MACSTDGSFLGLGWGSLKDLEGEEYCLAKFYSGSFSLLVSSSLILVEQGIVCCEGYSCLLAIDPDDEWDGISH